MVRTRRSARTLGGFADSTILSFANKGRAQIARDGESLANIPIRDITQTGIPTATSNIVFDDGSMKKATVADLADGVRPVASQSEAQTGSDNSKTMSPLRVKQSIASEVGVTIASKSQGDAANTALQPAAIGSTIQAYDADLASIAGLSPANNDFLQRKSGAWVNRTPAQAKDDLSLSTVATSGSYNDLSGLPTLGDLAAKDQAAIADIAATGAPSSTTALFGDGTWKTPAGGGDMIKASNLAGLPDIREARSNIGLGDSSLSQYDTKSQLHNATVPTAAAFVRTVSNSLTSKLGAAIYSKVADEPSHALKEQSADGTWWDLSAPRVDATMAGMVGDNNYDNGQALADAMGYAGMFGAEVFLPRGRYKVAATTQMISPAAPPSIIGEGGNASIIEAAAGEYYAMEFKDCEGMHLQGFRVRKPVGGEDYLGGAIYIHETPYLYLHDVAVWGFAVGLELVNVVSGEFSRLLSLYNDIGVRASANDSATGLITRPNALTFISPTWGANKSWGGYFTEPALLKIAGGSIEGNGAGVVSNHGGLYIYNAGTEGGVGLNLNGVQMERNKGDADVYIVGTANAGTVYNIEGCGIFPIDNTNYTNNRIHFENSVQQNLNLRGNSFKHFGTYTPSSSRKVITAASPSLVSVNLCGDIKQFYSTAEFPVGFGAMGMSYGGRVAADGSAVNLPAGWSSSKTGTGQYAIALPSYLNGSDFGWAATTNSGNPYLVQRMFVTSSEIDIVTTDIAGTLIDAAFTFTASPVG